MAKRQLKLPDPNSINDNTPLRLEVAAALAFPGGGMTASGLRIERGKGTLNFERIANKDFVTLGAIEDMRKLCARSNQQGLRSGKPDLKKDSPQHGSFGTMDKSTPQDALRAILKAQKLPTRNTT